MSETIKLSDLQPDVHNANRGTERGRALLEKSLHQYGAGRSILLDKNGRIIAGNKTAETAGEIGIDDVIVVRTKGDKLVAVLREDLDLSDDETAARMLAYADNRVGQIDLDFDTEVLLEDFNAGFELNEFWFEDELNDLFSDIEGYDNGTGEPSDAEPQINRADELREKWGVETGQLWELGNHRLYVGDSTVIDPTQVFGECPQNLFFDPPWDEGILSPSGDWENVLAFCDGKRASDIIDLFGSPTWVFVWDCVTSWYTPNRPLRRGKLCFWYGDIENYNFDGAHYGEAGQAKTVTNTRGTYDYIPDQRGKHLADVYQQQITAVHSEGASHSKPIDWIRLLIGDCVGGDVYDPFLGSGVTLRACEQLGYRCFGVELSPTGAAVSIQLAADFGLVVNCAE